MKASLIKVLVVSFMAIPVFSYSMAQNSNTEIVSTATVPLKKQLEFILREVTERTGKNFNIAAVMQPVEGGGFFAAYEIAGQQDTYASQNNSIGREILNINILGVPTYRYLWSISQNTNKLITKTHIDGSVTEIELEEGISNLGKLVKESPLTIDEQFEQVLAQVEEITGKQFNFVIEESIVGDDVKGEFARAYAISEPKRIPDPQTAQHKSPESLAISISRYPSRPSQNWIISQMIGDELLLTHFNGAITKEKHFTSGAINNVDVEGIFGIALEEIFMETGQRFDEIISEHKSKNNVARAYKISSDNSQSFVVLTINVISSSNGKHYSWSISK